MNAAVAISDALAALGAVAVGRERERHARPSRGRGPPRGCPAGTRTASTIGPDVVAALERQQRRQPEGDADRERQAGGEQQRGGADRRTRSSPSARLLLAERAARERREQRGGGYRRDGERERRRKQPGERRRDDRVRGRVVAAVPLPVPDREALLAEQVGAEGVCGEVDRPRLPDQVDDRERDRDRDRRDVPPVDALVPRPPRQERRAPARWWRRLGARVCGGAVTAARAARSTAKDKLAARPQEVRCAIDQLGVLEPRPVAALDHLELGLAAERVGEAPAELRADVGVARQATGPARGSELAERARRGARAPPAGPSGRGSGSRAGCRGRSPPRRGRRSRAAASGGMPRRVVKPIVSSPTSGVRHARATRCHSKPGSSGTQAKRTSRSIRSGKRWAKASADRAPVVHHERHALETGVLAERLDEAVVARRSSSRSRRAWPSGRSQAGRARRPPQRSRSGSQSQDAVGTPCT